MWSNCYNNGGFVTKNKSNTSLPTVTEITEHPVLINMCPEEAIKIAEETFEVLGAGEDVKVTEIYLCESKMYPSQCYGIFLRRFVDEGLPIRYLSTANIGTNKAVDDTSDQFNSGVPYEMMVIFINDSGIIDLWWKEPMEKVDVINPNVSILPSNDISELFKQAFEVSYVYYEDKPWSLNYQLDEARLTYGIARIPDENDVYMALPLWHFYATQELIPNGKDEQVDYDKVGLLTINAIDGTRFNTWWGY